jgi:hypothetical protein
LQISTIKNKYLALAYFADYVNIYKVEDTPILLGYYYRICIFAKVGVTSTNLQSEEICDIS